ncbi:MAG: formate--tetrahydrofolate ligase [Thermoplasmata archaeon]
MKDLEPILKIAQKIGLTEEDLELYGKYMAKVSLEAIKKYKNNKDGKLIVVTAMTPTPAGEGKTTTSIGLVQGMTKLGKKTMLAIREPSLGPVFGIKGGATGGGKAMVEPMEEINLHFTGDFHAITSAHNLLSAMINNHIYFRNEPRIDQRKITWRRLIDMNDRSLRHIIVGLGESNGVIVEEGFDITPASEIMAIMALAENYKDLKSRLGNILVGYSEKKEPIFARDLKADGAMAALLKNALKPNLVQTIEHVPVFVHIGPFGNIAHGTNSVIADHIGIKLVDYFVTETGFGSDLGFQKFVDVVSRASNLKISVVVLVASIRALKMHGGVQKEDLKLENVAALQKGFENLQKHITNIRNYGLPLVVAINKFVSDTDSEIKALESLLKTMNVSYSLSTSFEDGGNGAVDLAKKVIEEIDAHPDPKVNYTYSLDDPLETRIYNIATKIYGAKDVIYTKDAINDLKLIKKNGFDKFHVIMAKTQNSLSDDPKLVGAPKDFTVTVRELRVLSGAGFIVVILGEIMTMPGLPKEPAAVNVTLTDDGEIKGLF